MDRKMTAKTNSGCTVLVASCDKYADLLDPFSALWRKFWPDCPFETVLVTETTPAEGLAFDQVVACGKGGNWCARLVVALKQIKTRYVLLLCDDYYLAAPVDTMLVLKRLDQAKRFDAANLRLIPNPETRIPYREDLCEYKKNTAYCIATQTGIWNREFLLRLAHGKTSIWEFERRGSFDLSDEARPLLVTPTKEFPFVDAVHKGCWEPFGVQVLKENGIGYDFTRRGLPPLRTKIVEGLKGLVFRLVPTTLLVRVQNALNAGAKESPSSDERK